MSIWNKLFGRPDSATSQDLEIEARRYMQELAQLIDADPKKARGLINRRAGDAMEQALDYECPLHDEYVALVLRLLEKLEKAPQPSVDELPPLEVFSDIFESELPQLTIASKRKEPGVVHLRYPAQWDGWRNIALDVEARLMLRRTEILLVFNAENSCFIQRETLREALPNNLHEWPPEQVPDGLFEAVEAISGVEFVDGVTTTLGYEVKYFERTGA